jgi:hypothetical protein
MEFVIQTLVSVLVVLLILWFVLNRRVTNPICRLFNTSLMGSITILNMFIGKYGAGFGWPWWIYYPVPMILTIFFPMVYFKMKSKESLSYLMLTTLAAPVLHVLFSFFIGWKNYLPFIPVPSIWELVG